MSVSPIAKATLQAAAINAGSNIVAQGIVMIVCSTYVLTILDRMPAEHPGGNPSSACMQRPFELDTRALLQFTACALIVTPLSFLWLEGLESSLPGTSKVPAPAPKGRGNGKGKGKGKGKGQPQKRKPKLNIWNTAAKVMIDQTIGGTWVTVLFIATMGMLKGLDYDAIVAQVRNDFWPIMTAGLKLWPFVSILNFTLVPADKRLLVGSLFGFVWAIYLSLVSG